MKHANGLCGAMGLLEEDIMKFVIVGCGRMGSGVARSLGQRSHTLAVIDNDPAAFERLGPTFKGKTVHGHGLDRTALEEAGVAQADGLAAATGSDDLNIIVALLARQCFHVPKVVARLYDPKKAETYRRLGISTIAPITWGITRVCESLLFPRLRTIASLGNGTIDLLELEIPPSLAGRTLADLAIPQEIQAVAVQRGGKTLLAANDMPLQSSDIAFLAVLSTAVDRLNAQLGII
jgi:trk system potassium uptake protein TrkA